MLKTSKLFFLFMFACVGSLAANQGYMDGWMGDGCCNNGEWRLIGEYLYMTTSVGDSYYVVEAPESSDFPIGKRQSQCCDFHSGYRVGAGYSFCECARDVFVTYTSFDFNKNKRSSGEFLWGTIGSSTFLESFSNYSGIAAYHQKVKYQRIDAIFSQGIFDCCGLNVKVGVGLEAVNLKLNERVRYEKTGTTGVAHRHSKTDGIGPEIGFAFNYALCNLPCFCYNGHLSLNVMTAGSLLAAESKAKSGDSIGSAAASSSSSEGFGTGIRDKRCCRIIPAFHTRAGLNYEVCFECLDASVEVGYEFNSYIRARSRNHFAGTGGTALSFNTYDDFDLQGLYVALNLKF